jgi:hypothetical protein
MTIHENSFLLNSINEDLIDFLASRAVSLYLVRGRSEPDYSYNHKFKGEIKSFAKPAPATIPPVTRTSDMECFISVWRRMPAILDTRINPSTIAI